VGNVGLAAAFDSVQIGQQLGNRANPRHGPVR
jgi:hypothetical protein